MKGWRIKSLGGILMAALLILAAPGYGQEKFPKGTMTFLVGFGPGGGVDLFMRGLAEYMKKEFKIPAVVENKPGGGGSLAYSLLQGEKPDGYTLGAISNSIILETFKTKGKVDYRKVEPIINLSTAPMAITVHADSPWKTIEEFLAYARANPAKIRVGNSGMGAIYHIFAVSLERKTGVTFTHVPFKTGPESGTALLGKHIDAASQALSDLVASLETGKLRVLATSGEKRDPFFPDVPTFKERGIDVVIGIWRGVGAPKGTPPDRLEILEKAFLKAVQTPEWIQLMQRLRLENNYQGAAEFRKIYYRDAEVLEPLARGLEK